MWGCLDVFGSLREVFFATTKFFQIHLCSAFMLHFSRGCLQMMTRHLRHLWSVAQSHPLISWNGPKRLLWVTSWDNPGDRVWSAVSSFFWSWPAFDHHQTGKGFYMTSHHDIAKLVLGTSWYRNVGEARPAMFRLMELGALGGSALIAGSMFLFTSFVKARRTPGGFKSDDKYMQIYTRTGMGSCQLPLDLYFWNKLLGVRNFKTLKILIRNWLKWDSVRLNLIGQTECWCSFANGFINWISNFPFFSSTFPYFFHF